MGADGENSRSLHCLGAPFKPYFGLSGIPQHSTCGFFLTHSTEHLFRAQRQAAGD